MDDGTGMLTAAAAVALVGALVTLVSLVVLHVLPTGLSPLRDPVSQYGITRYRAGYRVAAVAAGVAGLGMAALLGQATGRWSVPVVLLLVFALARILIAFFPMDAPGTPPTARGRVHLGLAIIAFFAVTVAAFLDPGRSDVAGLGPITLACAILMALGTVGIVIARRSSGPSLFGLFERLIYAGFLAWFLVVGILVLV
ncbi:DUF998 domain-containing protein [Humibacter albus]|uniref:DUF998 domain-containing protein n=1 Tax=Humibacter albus TaxID=427754 RepID=UPI0003B47562|nr:DUF998 domain-containing protein [Humibacter albus]